jgi:hypothetical protein
VSDDFDRRLEARLAALKKDADPPSAPRYLALRTAPPRWRLRLASVPALMGTKLLAGAGALAVAAAGVGIKTAVTGSPSPLIWSHGAQTVVQCKASPTARGEIGRCVSTSVRTNHAGAEPPDSAPASHAAPGRGASSKGSPSAIDRTHPAHPTHSPKPTPAHPTSQAYPTHSPNPHAAATPPPSPAV